MISSLYERISLATPACVSSAATRTDIHMTGADEGRVEKSQDDRIVFSNGGSIKDLPGESGLQLTYPNGETRELSGRIIPNAAKNRLEIQQQVQDTAGGALETWTQALNANGTVSFERAASSEQDWITADVSICGKVSGWATNSQGVDFKPQTELQNGQIVFADANSPTIGLQPAVPMEWLLA